jgi:cation:H+ antiporter
MDFNDQALWLTIAVFCACAAVVWWAGTRLAGYAARFSTATGIGGAAVGLVLLGAVTSLPEIATSITASVAGEADLAVNNLVGGVSFQLVVLALVDMVIGRRALTSTLPRADLLAQAAMGVMMLCVVVAAVVTGEAEVFGFGLGAALLVAVYGAAIAVSRSMDQDVRWRPAQAPDGWAASESRDDEGDASEREPIGHLLLLIAGTGLVILVAGYLLTRSGEAIAERSGLGSSFFGAVFLAGATSLPEVSSAIAAVRLKRPQLAIGDVLGGNMFNLALVFLVDVTYRGGPVLAEVGAFSVLAAAIGILLNAVLIVGILERRDRTVLWMGYDSLAILLLYGCGLGLLYQLRP